MLAYGRTKLEAEAAVTAIPGGLVTRVSLLYGPNPSGRPGFFDLAIDALRRGEPRDFFRDEFRTPLDYRTAADALVRLVESDAVRDRSRRGPRAAQPLRIDETRGGRHGHRSRPSSAPDGRTTPASRSLVRPTPRSTRHDSPLSSPDLDRPSVGIGGLQ